MTWRAAVSRAVLWACVTCVVTQCVVPVCCAASYDDLVRLREHLFTNNSETTRDLRPVQDIDDTLIVSIYVHVYAIGVVVEKDQTVETSMRVEIEFIDENLKWDTSQFSNITNITVFSELLYLPDVFIENDAAEHILSLTRDIHKKKIDVNIENTGKVHYVTSEHVRTFCTMDMTYYPYDVQRCDVTFKAKAGIGLKDLSYKYASEEPFEDPSWIFENETAFSDGSHNLYHSFILKRRTPFYVLAMMMPLLFLSFANSVTMILPPESGEKMSLSMSVLLAYSFYLGVITEYLPKTSLNISLLNLYLTQLFGICTSNVIASAIILLIHYRPVTRPVGPKMQKLCVMMGVATQKKTYDLNAYELNSNGTTRYPNDGVDRFPDSYKKDKDEVGWTQVARALDRLSVIISAFLSLVITIVFFLWIFIGSEMNKPTLDLPPNN